MQKESANLKLVLNGDDPLCVQFGREENVKAYYYGISEKVLPQLDDTKEGRFCPVCGEEQKYNYYHYSQLGDFIARRAVSSDLRLILKSRMYRSTHR